MRISLCLTTVLLLASGHATGAQEAIRVDTLPGGRVVVSNPDLPGLTGDAIPTLVEDLRIGSLEGICDSFGEAFSIAVDGAGRTFVADLQVNEIRVFSPRGECLGTIGRRGEGPGEFSMLAAVAWQPPELLWAVDALQSRLTVFDSAGEPLATQRFGSGRSASLPWLVWMDSGRRLHLWHPGERVIVRYAPGPEIMALDTLAVPRVESDLLSVRGRGGTTADTRRGVTAISPLPHTPRIAWTVGHNGNLWLVHTSSFELHETTWSGDTIRTVRLERPPPPLEGRERDSIAGARGIPARRLPERKRVLQRFSVGADGWIWVERGERPIRQWDVFDEGGRYLGPVVPPVAIEDEPFPVFGAGTVTAVTEDELGVQYVVRLRVVR